MRQRTACIGAIDSLPPPGRAGYTAVSNLTGAYSWPINLPVPTAGTPIEELINRITQSLGDLSPEPLLEPFEPGD